MTPVCRSCDETDGSTPSKAMEEFIAWATALSEADTSDWEEVK